MKKILFTILLSLLSFLSTGQTKKTYAEFNAGISTGILPFFPGGSLLYGKTITYESGFVLDYEGGIAFPSIVTGKIGIGCTIKDDAEITFGVRPWPATSYIQLQVNRANKRSDLVFSLERMWGRDFFIQDALITVGWRFDGRKQLFKR